MYLAPVYEDGGSGVLQQTIDEDTFGTSLRHPVCTLDTCVGVSCLSDYLVPIHVEGYSL